jgi:hypothetical protein
MQAAFILLGVVVFITMRIILRTQDVKLSNSNLINLLDVIKLLVLTLVPFSVNILISCIFNHFYILRCADLFIVV